MATESTESKKSSVTLGLIRYTVAGAAALAMVPTLSGCTHKSNNTIYMPDMVYSESFKAQEVGSMRTPPKGTIPRGFVPYQYAGIKTADEAGRVNATNPHPRTKANLQRGQALFNTYCIVCHGAYGEGDGSIIPKFPRPPSLQSDKVRGWPDGAIFHVMAMGQNNMPSYASQISQDDRWKVVHYVRALQRAKNPTAQDMEAMKASTEAEKN